jgi:uncharacterized protein
MRTTPPHVTAKADTASHASGLHHLNEAIERAAHLLPAQGPITVFIHHNTLHGFEHVPFHVGVKQAASVFGCQPYLTEDRYREELRLGRIRFDKLKRVLAEDLGDRAADQVPLFGTRLELRLAMLQYPLRTGPTPELIWFVAEANAMRRVRSEASFAVRSRLIAETRRWVVRDLRGIEGCGRNHVSADGKESLIELLKRFGGSRIESWTHEDWEGFTLHALWRVCCDGVRDLLPFTSPPPLAIRPRDLLFEATGEDTDALVHSLLIPYCAAFLDQGLARWPLPRRHEGFLCAFSSLYRQPGGSTERWRRGLSDELARLEDEGIGPLESIHESLQALGVSGEEWEPFLSSTLLALRGWAGMLHHVESRGDRVVHPIPRGSLIEFLAVRLILDRLATAHVARTGLGVETPVREFWHLLREQVDPYWPPSVEQRAFLVFQLAQIFGTPPGALHELSRLEWTRLLREIEEFSGLERRRIFHEAYEQRFYTQSLDAIALHSRHSAPTPRTPRFQAIFCIDEREESIRRQVEEIAPDSTTFGTAGFFSIPMYFRGAGDAHFVPLCPAVVRPRHYVVEQVVAPLEAESRRRARSRAFGMASHRFHAESRSIGVGAVLTALLGVLASFPLVAGTLFPRLTAQFRRRMVRFVQPPRTRLQLERIDPDPRPDLGYQGFTIDEMTDIAEKVLREIGLTSGFARLVLAIGHGSTSMNNPHESAHDCGACGGARGGPNGRALAQMLNERRVRERLALRGLTVPDHTIFVGGMHNTSNESMTFYDADLVPESHREEFEAARADIERACDHDAHERCRRFRSAPLTSSLAAARQHVEGRAEDLAQVRPEWGHATNGLCVVGRRELTRGLFLDRRAFLTSYNPDQDDADGTILERILQAVVPVCAGISLEYYFSYVDNKGWGAGTKLPHNIACLLGVMDGASSDLRTGLPWQMVEIHEPVRIVFVVETTTETIARILSRNPGIARLCRNAWVRLAVIAPDTRRLSVFIDGEFRPYEPQSTVLPQTSSSYDWYRGWRDHLEFAEIARGF